MWRRGRVEGVMIVMGNVDATRIQVDAEVIANSFCETKLKENSV